MYVSVGSAQIKPEHVNDLAKAFEQTFKQSQGQREAYMLVNGDQRQVMIIGLWDSEADSKAFESSQLFREYVKSIHGFLEGTPSRETLKVAVHLAQ